MINFFQLIKRIYRNQQFSPALIPGLFLNPFFIVRRSLSKVIQSISSDFRGGALLDVGCGSKPYQQFFDVERYFGIDIQSSGHDHESSKIDCFYDGKSIPSIDGTFEFALSSEVLEHVFNPEELLKEIHRVLKPNGKLALTCPFVWGEHETPYDFARYTSFGVSALLQRNGFKVIRQEKLVSSVATITQMIAAYTYQECLPSNKIVRHILTPIVIGPINSIGLILEKILPRDFGLYSTNIVIAVKS